MTITLRSTIPIMIIAVYMYTAEVETTEKKKLYEEITNIANKASSKHIIHIVGDFNARIQIKTNEEEKCIGKHTFNKEKITIEQQNEKVEESRNMLINLCVSTDTILMNTQFQKPSEKLATHRRPNSETTPFERPHYEMIDYWLTHNRWKNSVTNVETDPIANITTDHLPMIITTRVNLKASKKEIKENRIKYEVCDKTQK